MNIVFNCYPGGLKKALTMSYDDGCAADKRLAQIFNKYNIKGTFHLNSKRLNSAGSLSEDDIKTFFQNHEISAHTWSHPFPNYVPKESLIFEIYRDRQILEEVAGYPVRGMSYPYGNYNQEVISEFRALGMEYSRTTKSTNSYDIPADFMEWHPTCHHKGDILNKLEYFKNPPRRIPNLMLFYVWGHAFEFDNDKNWELIEEFCEKASKLENVWFATNIEIYNYITALKSLRFGIDRTTVYNPSALTCYFEADGKMITVEPGQTLKY